MLSSLFFIYLGLQEEEKEEFMQRNKFLASGKVDVSEVKKFGFSNSNKDDMVRFYHLCLVVIFIHALQIPIKLYYFVIKLF